MEGCSNQDCIAKNRSIIFETFRSYFVCHSENLDKIFTLRDYPYNLVKYMY